MREHNERVISEGSYPGDPPESDEEDDGGPLTVAALIAKLQEIPMDSIVTLQGCDCWGDAGGVEEVDTSSWLDKQQLVLILRWQRERTMDEFFDLMALRHGSLVKAGLQAFAAIRQEDELDELDLLGMQAAAEALAADALAGILRIPLEE